MPPVTAYASDASDIRTPRKFCEKCKREILPSDRISISLGQISKVSHTECPKVAEVADKQVSDVADTERDGRPAQDPPKFN